MKNIAPRGKTHKGKSLCGKMIILTACAGMMYGLRAEDDEDTRCVIENFREIASVPRRTHHEEQISAWLCDWAKGMGLGVVADKSMNVVIDVPATPGWEDLPLVALQAHMDMVAAWKEGTSHDWDRDPIIVAEEEVDGVRYLCSADHLTSLGADDGIGIATAMAVAQGRVDHGPVRIIITTDEEDTQTGAKGLAPDFYREAAALINLDSEDDGVVTISSAASDDEIVTGTPSMTAASGQKAYGLKLEGFRGGHSGIDIDKGRLSAIRELAAVLKKLAATDGCELVSFDGGSAANAIPTFANAVIVVDADRVPAVEAEVSAALADFRGRGESAASFTMAETEMPAQAMTADFRDRFLGFVTGIINGVHSMSAEVPGLVESSSNLGLVSADGSGLSMRIMARSSSDPKSAEITGDHRARAESAGFAYSYDRNCYPWPVDPSSRLLQNVTNSWKTVFGYDMKVVAIHAGLECGYFKSMVPSLDVVSIGPTVANPHTVRETCRIDTIGRQLKLLRAVFANMRPTDVVQVTEREIVAGALLWRSLILVGVMLDGTGRVTGSVEVKLARANTKTGLSRVTGSVTPLGGKKLSLKATESKGYDFSAGPQYVDCDVKGMGRMRLFIGSNAAANVVFTGEVGEYTVTSATIGGKTFGTEKMTVRLAADFRLGADGEISAYDGYSFLPDGEPIMVGGAKWKLRKSAAIKYAKPKGAKKSGKVLQGYDDPQRPNISCLKLVYKAKTGVFMGAFYVYALQGAEGKERLKRHVVHVKGIVADGRGFGTATCRDPVAGPFRFTFR